MKFKNTIPERTPSKEANPEARPVNGKSNMQDAVLRKGLQPKPEPIRQAEEVPGKALECIQQQVGVNGNPKVRDASVDGAGHAAAENKKTLSK